MTPMNNPIKVKLIGANMGTQLNKSMSSSLNNRIHNVDSSDSLYKSMPSRDAKAFEENPVRMMQATEYKDKPTSLSYNILYQMSVKNSVVAAVITTRVNQVSTFTKPKRFSTDGVGYEIRLRDPQAVPSKEQQEVIQSLEVFLENCGFNDDPDRDDFDTFIRKLVRDSLTYDQTCFEVIPDRKGKPAEIVAVDAATIRAASENYVAGSMWGDVPQPKKNDEISWVQVVDGTIVSWFTSKELAFGIRNPRSNINMQPYGFSELEMLIQQITSHLYAEEYNSKFFSQGGTTKGIINIKSALEYEYFEEMQDLCKQLSIEYEKKDSYRSAFYNNCSIGYISKRFRLTVKEAAESAEQFQLIRLQKMKEELKVLEAVEDDDE